MNQNVPEKATMSNRSTRINTVILFLMTLLAAAIVFVAAGSWSFLSCAYADELSLAELQKIEASLSLVAGDIDAGASDSGSTEQNANPNKNEPADSDADEAAMQKQSLKVSTSYGCFYVSRAVVAKRAVIGKNLITVKNAQGKVTYKNCSTSSAAKKIKVNARTGAITVPKGFKQKTTTLKIRVKAKGNANYYAASKTIQMKVQVTTRAQAIVQVATKEYKRVKANGTFAKGGKRYWKLWHTERVPWCSEFVGWCAIQAGLTPGRNFPADPITASEYVKYFKANPQYGKVCKISAKSLPKAGDIIIKFNTKKRPFHTGLVISSSRGIITTVEGNANDKLTSRTYNLKKPNRWYYYIRLAS